jgi:hypothetical protein
VGAVPSGSWALVQELFSRGEPRFVEELRSVHEPEKLGAFAEKWIADIRPFARKAIFDYLTLPLNSYRHEPLVKRLFKLAEKNQDDELMGAFLVAFDLLLRMEVRQIHQMKYEQFKSYQAAEAATKQWLTEGYQDPVINQWSGTFYAHARKTEPKVVYPQNKMPRPPEKHLKKAQQLQGILGQRFRKRFILFSMATRRYLRRRAWRYFRKLGQSNSERYIQAAVAFLPRYTDAQLDSSSHLLDSWGLVHTLFHHSSALENDARGWKWAPGKSIAELKPAPFLRPTWTGLPHSLLKVLQEAKSQTVRQWALTLLQTDHAEWLANLPLKSILELVDHPHPEVSNLGFDLLEKADLSEVPIEEWLTRLDGDHFEKLQRLSAILRGRIRGEQLTLEDTIWLTGHRSLPVTELGFTLLQQKNLSQGDIPSLLPLAQAESESLRPELLLWFRQQLEQFGPVQSEWVLELLDSKHRDVRKVGLDWWRSSSLRDDSQLWQQLTESPYEEIRNQLIETLQQHVSKNNPDQVHLLWATVLLDVARGGRQKPEVISQVTQRLQSHQDESEQLLPLLAIAVRSLRATEFRAGLTGIVRLAESQPELVSQIRQKFPELEI